MLFEHDRLKQTLRDAPALTMLGSPNAPLIITFLHHQFKQQHHLTMPHSLLAERLNDYLQQLRRDEPDMYPRSAEQYLDDWCHKHGLLRKYHPVDSDDAVYELTVESERALGWVEELRRRSFVGTESRFRYIFDLLQDIVRRSDTDPEARLRYLREERDRITAEIDRIEAGGAVETYNTTQIKEKFFEANDTARRLLADFREVEENFRQISRDVEQRQLEADVSKGEIVGYVLDAEDALQESDQGRSFYAFWQFLMSPSKDAELRQLLEKTFALTAVPQTGPERRLLQQLKRNLINAGSKIVATNGRLAAHLRKLLDEQYLEEARRVRELTAEIKQLAVTLKDRRLPDPFVAVVGPPVVHLPLARPLWTPSPQPDFSGVVVAAPDDTIPDADLNALLNQFYVDTMALQTHIDLMLEEAPAVSLDDLVRARPIQKGLAEMVAYFNIADRTARHIIRLDQQVTVPLDETGRLIHVPQIVFCRE